MTTTNASSSAASAQTSASLADSQVTDDLAQQTSAPAKLPGMDVHELQAFRVSEEGKKLVAWAQSQFDACRSQRQTEQTQWIYNLRMVMGQQHLKRVSINGKDGFQPLESPKYAKAKTINRLRSYVRTEHSKFQSTYPNIVVVPASADDDDIRASYAAEQIWSSMQSTKHLERTHSRSVWWMIMTGNGFLKQWWDPGATDSHGQPIGDVKFEAVSPFHLFVPDLFERELDAQPYVIQAQTKTTDWVQAYYPEELKGVDLNSNNSGDGGSSQIDEAFRQVVNAPKQKSNTVTVYEFWVRKGATSLLPEGGLLVLVGDTLVTYHEGFPYEHGQFPYSHYDHITTDTFYSVSPLVDLVELQKEFNEIRSDLSLSAKRMGRPQLLAVEGSIITTKMTNEPGGIIPVRPGFQLPTPMPLAALPEYVVQQQDRVLADFEDISGQHEVSKGTAPTGVSAGTALSFLKETDDAYLTPQYNNIEQAVERTAVQALALFNQYVDLERKIKTAGDDGSFDVLLLEGTDISSGLDIRVERGSSIGESQAAKQARILEMFDRGLIDAPNALRMMEMGGPAKALDVLNVASRKAQRENIKMKGLDPAQIAENTEAFVSQTLSRIMSDPASAANLSEMGPQEIIETIEEAAPPLIPVDDFDIHEIHLEEHNKFRMTPAFEMLPDEIKQEFQKHVGQHEQYLQEAMQMQMMQQMGPQPGGPGGAPAGPEDQGAAAPGPAPMPESVGGPAGGGE